MTLFICKHHIQVSNTQDLRHQLPFKLLLQGMQNIGPQARTIRTNTLISGSITNK